MKRSTRWDDGAPATATAKAALKAEVEAWAKRIGVQPLELHIRRMRQKWGSCSTRGRVTLNSDLFSASAELRREVIVEELLHLRVPNHGRLFRALKRAYLSDVDKRRIG